MSLIIAAIAVLALAFLIAYLFPEGTSRWVDRLVVTKNIFFGFAGLVFALFLLGTGAAGLMLLGGAILLFMALFVLDRGPEEILSPDS